MLKTPAHVRVFPKKKASKREWLWVEWFAHRCSLLQMLFTTHIARARAAENPRDAAVTFVVCGAAPRCIACTLEPLCGFTFFFNWIFLLLRDVLLALSLLAR